MKDEALSITAMTRSSYASSTANAEGDFGIKSAGKDPSFFSRWIEWVCNINLTGCDYPNYEEGVKFENVTKIDENTEKVTIIDDNTESITKVHDNRCPKHCGEDYCRALNTNKVNLKNVAYVPLQNKISFKRWLEALAQIFGECDISIQIKQAFLVNAESLSKYDVKICKYVDSQIEYVIRQSVNHELLQALDRKCVSTIDQNSVMIIAHLMDIIGISLDANRNMCKLYGIKLKNDDYQTFAKEIRDTIFDLELSNSKLSSEAIAEIVINNNKAFLGSDFLMVWNSRETGKDANLMLKCFDIKGMTRF